MQKRWVTQLRISTKGTHEKLEVIFNHILPPWPHGTSSGEKRVVPPTTPSPSPFSTRCHPQAPGPRSLVLSWLRGSNSYTTGKKYEINENSVELFKPNFLWLCGEQRGGLEEKSYSPRVCGCLQGTKPAAGWFNGIIALWPPGSGLGFLSQTEWIQEHYVQWKQWLPEAGF